MILSSRLIINFALLSAVIIATLPQQATSQTVTPPAAPAKIDKRFLPFKKFEVLRNLLKRHGFTDRQISLINRQGLLPKGLSLSNGEKYRLQQSADRRYAEIKIYEAPRNLAYIFWRNKDDAGALLREEKFQVKEKTVRGQVRGSLLASISQVVPFAWTAYRFMDAYTFDHNLPKQLQRGAQFQFKVETKYDGADLIGYGEILQTSLQIGARTERRFYVRYPGGGTFLNPEGSQLNRPLYSPVNYVRVSSLFNPRRFHPIKNRSQAHLGVDFELPEGSDVFAVESGVVLRSGFQRASGNFVVLRHANGLESYYNHLRALMPNLEPGTRIQNGQKVGEIGCTGYCTKAHLHFAVKRAGQFVNPLAYLKNYPYRSHALINQQFAQLSSIKE